MMFELFFCNYKKTKTVSSFLPFHDLVILSRTKYSAGSFWVPFCRHKMEEDQDALASM